jgi:hypothetical protein
MNTYHKFIPNVFLAKCNQEHEKGELIILTTKYGKENECEVYNLIFSKDGFLYYSIVRTDGFNYAEKRAERLQNAALNAEKKSDQYYKTSHIITDNIPMGQPILVGHHSEAGHRRLLDKSWKAMGKSVEFSDKAETYEQRAAYWERKASEINLSMPESLEFYEFELEKAKAIQEGMKKGTIPREHSYSLVYATKAVKDCEMKLNNAKLLWQ